MPRRRIRRNREAYDFPDDLPECLKRFGESGCRGRKSPAVLRPIATPRGVGGKAGRGPAADTAGRCRNWPATWGWPTCSPDERAGRFGAAYRMAAGYSVPAPDDIFLAGRVAENITLDDSVLSAEQVGPPTDTADGTLLEHWREAPGEIGCGGDCEVDWRSATRR